MRGSPEPTVLLVALLPAEAGKKKKEPPPAPEPAPAPAAPAAATPAADGADPFAGFDRAAALAKLQGVWHVVAPEYGAIGAVIDVKDTAARVVTARDDQVFALDLVSPCRYLLREGTGWRAGTYAFDGETLLSGAVAQRVGDRIYACVGDGVHVVEGGGCTKWKLSFDETTWERSPGVCRTNPDGSLVIEDGGLTFTLTSRGEALQESVAGTPTFERLPDLATGLARVRPTPAE